MPSPSDRSGSLSLVSDAMTDDIELGEADPESDFISWCLQHGSWSPADYGLSAKDFPVNARLFRYLTRYHSDTGELPPAETVAEHYPAFTYSPDIHPKFSSRILRDDTFLRDAAQTATDLVHAIRDNNIAEIQRISSTLSTLMPSASSASALIDATDPRLYTNETILPVFRSDSDSLNVALDGGFAEGSFTVVGARTNVGKSLWLMQQGYAAAKQGCDVAYLSLEMPTSQCMDRLWRMITGDQFAAMSMDQLRDATINAFATEGGKLGFRSSTNGSLTPSQVVGFAANHDVVIVDYAALMSTDAGEAHATGWNAAAEIVDGLQLAAKQSGTPVLTAAQLNRDARPPSGRAAAVPGDNRSNIGKMNHTDKYAHNPDVIITLHRMSETITLNIVEKHRTGRIVAGWYTRFLPGIGDFSDVDPATAKQIIDAERGSDYDD